MAVPSRRTPSSIRSGETFEKFNRSVFLPLPSGWNGCPGTNATFSASASARSSRASTAAGSSTQTNIPPAARVHVQPGGNHSPIARTITSRRSRYTSRIRSTWAAMNAASFATSYATIWVIVAVCRSAGCLASTNRSKISPGATIHASRKPGARVFENVPR
jgi:hypothetical protein